MSRTPAPVAVQSPLRRGLTFGALIVLAVAGAWQLQALFAGKPELPIDFVCFWTAGRLNAEGRDPYSVENVKAMLRFLGWDGTAIIMWNPPWMLTLVTPIGLAPIEAACRIWMLVHLALLVASIFFLWKGFGGPARLWWVPQFIALTFTPTIFLLGSGQVTMFVLFGLSGFLYFGRIYRPFCAGLCVSLAATKPHLLAPFAAWLLVGSFSSSFARRIVLGGLLMGLAASLPPTLTNPHVWSQYLDTVGKPSSEDHHHLKDWKPPLAGWWLRQAVPGNPFVVQWVPLAAGLCALGLLGLAAHRVGKDQNADAIHTCSFDLPSAPASVIRSLPFLVGCSLLTAPYGAWPYDLVLLLIPIAAVTAQAARTPTARGIAYGLALLLAVDATSLVMMANHVSSEWYVWVSPVVLGGLAWTLRLLSSRSGAHVSRADTPVCPERCELIS